MDGCSLSYVLAQCRVRGRAILGTLFGTAVNTSLFFTVPKSVPETARPQHQRVFDAVEREDKRRVCRLPKPPLLMIRTWSPGRAEVVSCLSRSSMFVAMCARAPSDE